MLKVMKMKIDRLNENGVLTLVIDGRVDSTTAVKLDEEVEKAVKETDNLVLDCRKLDYISSAGLRSVLRAQKGMVEKKGTMKVTGVNDVVRDIFDITGFTDIITIE